MNRAEKTEPLPSCRGTHKGHPIRGDFMFNRIHIIYLAESYSLLYKECLELANKLLAYIKINNGYLLADKIDDLAKIWSKESVCNQKVQSVGNKITIKLAYNIMTSINEKTSIILTESEKNYIAMRCFILGSMTVDKREAILFLHKHGYTFKKESKGISRYLVEDIIKTIDIDMNTYRDYEKNTFPAFSVTKEKAAPVEEEEQISDSMPTREDVLAEVGKWHALEPANEAIHVGLMRLQDSSYREIYSKVFGEEVTGEFTKAMREKIRRRWCSFLNLADDRGIPKKTLEDMVSPR